MSPGRADQRLRPLVGRTRPRRQDVDGELRGIVGHGEEDDFPAGPLPAPVHRSDRRHPGHDPTARPRLYASYQDHQV
jgi:hypothetical protein